MNTMTMTTEAKKVNIWLNGTGNATIDWGDNSDDVAEIFPINDDDDDDDDDNNDGYFSHTYTVDTLHTITVKRYSF